MEWRGTSVRLLKIKSLEWGVNWSQPKKLNTVSCLFRHPITRTHIQVCLLALLILTAAAGLDLLIL